MMSFGWRPNQSCYQPVAQVSAPAPCTTPVWFWVALGVAVVAGVSNRKK